MYLLASVTGQIAVFKRLLEAGLKRFTFTSTQSPDTLVNNPTNHY